MTDDIFGRIQKAAVKISDSKNKTSLSDKIKAFNASVSDYNSYMDSLLDMIKEETKNLSTIEESHASKVATMLDKYNQIFNATKETIIDNTLNIIPNSINLIKNGENLSYSEDEYISKAQEIATAVKEKLQDYTNPEDTENRNYTSFKIISDISKTDTIKNSYILKNFFKIKKDANIKAVEFGFSIAQYNLSHFDIDSEFTIEDEKIKEYIGKYDNPNVIHRFYRGFIFITDIYDSEKTKIRAKIIAPDSDPIQAYNKTIGPEIDLSFSQDDKYIYIKINKFVPYRIDWNLISDEKYIGTLDGDYFDMLNEKNHNTSKIFFEIYGFFDDITRKDEYITKEEYASEEETKTSNEIDFNLSLSPSKSGFIKFVNFQIPTTGDLTLKSKKFNFVSHHIDKTIGSEDFNEFKKIDIKNSSEGDVKALSLFDDNLYLLKDKKVLKKNISSTLFKEITTLDITPFAIGKNSDFKKKEVLVLSSDFGIDVYKNGELNVSTDPSAEIMSYIKEIKEAKFVSTINGFLVYGKEGIFLYTYHGEIYDIRYLYHISSSDKLEKEMDTRLFVNEKFAYFIADNRITKFDYSNLSSPTTIIVVDKVLDTDKIVSVFYNKKTGKSELLYQNIETKAYKLITDLESTPFTEKILPSYYNDYEVRIFNHSFTDNVLITLTSKNETKITFVDPNYIFDSNYEPNFTSFETNNGSNRLFSFDPETGSMIFYTGSDFAIAAKGVSYKREKSFENIKNEILKTLKNETILRNEQNLLYKLQVFGTKLEKTFGDYNLDSLYTETGVFKDYEIEGFDFYNTKTTLFVVNKNNRTDIYIATSIPKTIENGNSQDARKFKMSHVVFPMGIREVIGKNIASTNEYFIGSDGEIYQFGSYKILDNNQVLVKPRKINNPESINNYKDIAIYSDKIYATDGIKTVVIDASTFDTNGDKKPVVYNVGGEKIEISEKGAIVLSYENNIVSKMNYIEGSTLHEIELVGIIFASCSKIVSGLSNFFFINSNGDVYKGKSPITELEIISLNNVSDIHTFIKNNMSGDADALVVEYNNELYCFDTSSSELKLIDTNVIIEQNMGYSLTLKNASGKLSNYGISNGYHYSARYANIDTPTILPDDTIQLGNDKILKCFADDNKTYIVTESGKLFVCGGKNIKKDPENNNELVDNAPYLGFGDSFDATKEADYFTESTNLPFDPKNIIDIKFDIYATFILLENGNLYACGSDYYGTMGIDSSKKDVDYYVKGFELINKKVSRIWTGYNRTIIEKTEKKKKVYYGSGSNKDGKLGALNNSEYRIWTKLTDINDLDTETIKEIYCFKTNTFVLTESGILYATGNNALGQLGVDDTSNLFEFARVPYVSKIETVRTNENNTLILLIDSSGKVYTSGTSESGLKTRVFTEIPLEENRKVTNIAIAKDDSYLLFFLQSNDGERKIVGYETTEGFGSEIDITIGNVTKVISASKGFYCLTEDKRLYYIKLDSDGVSIKDYYTMNYESDGSSLAFTKFNDIIKYETEKSSIKFIDEDNVIGIVTDTDNSIIDLSKNSLGVGVGKIPFGTSTSSMKAYLGTSNFDESSEAVHSGRLIEDFNNYSIKPIDSGKIMDCEETFDSEMISADLTIYPSAPNLSELKCTISGNYTNSGYGEFRVNLK